MWILFFFFVYCVLEPVIWGIACIVNPCFFKSLNIDSKAARIPLYNIMVLFDNTYPKNSDIEDMKFGKSLKVYHIVFEALRLIYIIYWFIILVGKPSNTASMVTSTVKAAGFTYSLIVVLIVVAFVLWFTNLLFRYILYNDIFKKDKRKVFLYTMFPNVMRIIVAIQSLKENSGTRKNNIKKVKNFAKES